jgi:putative transposase
MLIAHRIALDPNDAQKNYFSRAAGTARKAWNWALAEWDRQYKAGGKPNEMALRKQLNAIKKEQFPWMSEVTKNAPQQSIKNLGSAFNNFFAGRAKFPNFKKKGIHESFRADNGPQKKGVNAVAIKNQQINLPVIGWVRMHESLRFNGQIKSVVVSRTAHRWFASIQVDTPDLPVPENQGPVIGVDLGIKTLATLSNGESIEGPKALRRSLWKLRHESRSLARKKKGSFNRGKARMKVARLHARISNIRVDALHKLTTRLTKDFSVIGIEDLNVKGMIKNHSLARSIADMGFYEFRRQLVYKATMTGTTIVVANRWFPSSKTCCLCGAVAKELPLAVRNWSCWKCGARHDRDLNAAINLKNWAVSSTASACGGEGSGLGCKSLKVKPASVKQELSAKTTYG